MPAIVPDGEPHVPKSTVTDPRNAAETIMGGWDPLRISYVLVMEDDRLEDMTPFQGFGASWTPLLWALGVLVEMPESVVQPAWPVDKVITARMGGAALFAWRPMMVGALETLALDEVGFCVVLLSASEAAAARAARWAVAQPRPVLHVSSTRHPGTVPMETFDREALRAFCRSIFDAFGQTISAPRLEMALAMLDRWQAVTPIDTGIAEIGHNCALPNQMVLKRSGHGFASQVPHWSSVEEDDYTRVVIESAEAVMAMRDAVGLSDINRLFLPQPHVVLTEPALYRGSYKREAFDMRRMSPGGRVALRRVQNQAGLAHAIDKKDLQAMLEDPVAGGISAARAAELKIHALGVGLMAAQACAAVVRLRPAVNQVFPTLSNFARNIRAATPEARFKSPRLFAKVQRDLANAVGPERIAFIERHGGPITIVADAPLELLPIGGLPLGLRYDCSRINATPGNLMMGEMVRRSSLNLSPKELSRVLVVSSFSEVDPLRNLMHTAVEAVAPMLDGRVEVTFARVDSEDAFVDAVNASKAAILVIDSHGVADDGHGVGGLQIGGKSMNVWALRPRLRCPPIVILSACDTHGMDARSHSTVGNSFLAVGARAVLATQLPIGGVEAGVFVGRLLYRLAEFLPAALRARRRVLNWSETVTGMLRMTLASELCAAFLKATAAARAEEIATAANMDINMGEPAWFDRLVGRIADEIGADRRDVDAKVQAVISRSEAIRYVHLGHPADIFIDDGGIRDQFIPPGLAAALGVAPGS